MIVIIDASGFIFRAFHALPPLTNPSGEPVGAIMGFCTMAFKLFSRWPQGRFLAVFDQGRCAFRQKVFAEYKAHRPSPPPEIISQFQGVQSFCRAWGIPVVAQAGIEADDWIASLAMQASDAGQHVVVVSSDKDMAQLVTDTIHLFDPVKQRVIDPVGVQQIWGVPACLVPDVQALAGDACDHIPGIPGVGPKTATTWITQFQGLDNLLSNAQQLPTPKKQQLVTQYADQARMSYQLAYLRRDLPVTEVLQQAGICQDQARTFSWAVQPVDTFALATFVQQYGLRTLAGRLVQQGILKPHDMPKDKEDIHDNQDLDTDHHNGVKVKASVLSENQRILYKPGAPVQQHAWSPACGQAIAEVGLVAVVPVASCSPDNAMMSESSASLMASLSPLLPVDSVVVDRDSSARAEHPVSSICALASPQDSLFSVAWSPHDYTVASVAQLTPVLTGVQIVVYDSKHAQKTWAADLYAACGGRGLTGPCEIVDENGDQKTCCAMLTQLQCAKALGRSLPVYGPESAGSGIDAAAHTSLFAPVHEVLSSSSIVDEQADSLPDISSLVLLSRSSVLSADSPHVNLEKSQTYNLTYPAPWQDVLLAWYALWGTQKPQDWSSIRQSFGYPQPVTPAQDSVFLWAAWQDIRAQLQAQGLWFTYASLDLPLVPILGRMQDVGVQVDGAYLATLDHTWAQEMIDLEEKIFAHSGVRFSLASAKQLGEVLFDRLGWPGGKKGASGAYQTHSDVLQTLSDQGFAMADDIITWRQLAKLRSTYTAGLQAHISPDTGRVHTTYTLTQTATGRLSSVAPNVQNIPIRTIQGRKIRRAFGTPQGWGLLSLDYAQIELRLLAHMGPVPGLQQAFQAGLDIHCQTACALFGTPVDQVSDDQRRAAKTLNFGMLYGMSAFTLARTLHIAPAQAKALIQAYFDRYPGIQAYLDATCSFARQHGFVNTLCGRRCWIPGITSPKAMIRQAAQRQAINAPLQGTSADLIKLAMQHVDQYLRRCWHQPRLSDGVQDWPSPEVVLQIHDELVLQVPENDHEVLARDLKSLMEKALSMPLAVPLEVHWRFGRTWE